MPSHHDRPRRRVLESAGALSVLLLAGCVSSPSGADTAPASADAPSTEPATRDPTTTSERPTIERPAPVAERPTGPEPYPSAPDSLDDAAVLETAYAYEGAWIANRLAGEPCVDSYTLAPTVTDPEREVVTRGQSAMLADVKHPYAFSATRDDSTMHADVATEARYYVGTEAVVRVTGDEVSAPCR